MSFEHRTDDSDALHDEIRRTRAELGQTVQALAARVDVKARLRESATQSRQRLRAQAVQSGQRLRVQAAKSGQRLRVQAGQSGQRLRVQAGQTAGLLRSRAGRTMVTARDTAHDAGLAARRNPAPWAAVLLGAATVVLLVLVRRGRRG